MKNWEKNYNNELDQARIARSKGKEGMARVCARRAAGWLIGAYFDQSGIIFTSNSAVERLWVLNSLPGLPKEVYPAVNNLLLRVNPDYTFPSEIDLIKDVELIRDLLIGDQD